MQVPDEATMQQCAADLAGCWQAAGRPAGMLALQGDLGAGKSFFSRAFIRHLLNDPSYPVPSPTFTLVQPYPLPGGGEIWHSDLYRLEGPDDALALGLEEAFTQHLVLVEWPERLAPVFPEDMLTLTIRIDPLTDARQITLTAQGRLTACLPPSWTTA